MVVYSLSFMLATLLLLVPLLAGGGPFLTEPIKPIPLEVEYDRKKAELGIPFCQGVYVGEPSDALN